MPLGWPQRVRSSLSPDGRLAPAIAPPLIWRERLVELRLDNRSETALSVVGGFARGCYAGGVAQFALLSAAGSTPKSRIRYARVMGLKEETVRGIGFERLAIFRPGIIAGNAHTPGYVAWLGRLSCSERGALFYNALTAEYSMVLIDLPGRVPDGRFTTASEDSGFRDRRAPALVWTTPRTDRVFESIAGPQKY